MVIDYQRTSSHKCIHIYIYIYIYQIRYDKKREYHIEKQYVQKSLYRAILSYLTLIKKGRSLYRLSLRITKRVSSKFFLSCLFF